MNEQDYNNLISKIDRLDKRTKRMETGMFGDEKAGVDGFVQKQKKLEKQVDVNTETLHDSFIERFNETEERSKENENKLQKVWIYGSVAVVIIAFVVDIAIRIFT